MKRYLIVVDSRINLLFAVQLKRTLFPGEVFDIALSSIDPGLREIFEKKELERIFENVYYVNYKKISKINKIQALFRPKVILLRAANQTIYEYSDVFFWNPTEYLYFLLFELKKRRAFPSLHLYGDAMGAYVCDEPICSKLFSNQLICRYLELRYNYQPIGRYTYDYYVIGKEYMAFSSNRKIVDIPKFGNNDKDYLKTINSLFDFDTTTICASKYIFMDIVHKEKFKDSEIGLDYLKAVISNVPIDSISIKPHPRQNRSLYDNLNIRDNLLDMASPWEVYCLNHNIDDKVIITFGSSGAFLPYVYFDTEHTVICIDIDNTFNTIYRNEWSSFINKLKSKNKKIYMVYTPNELRETIRMIEGNGEK